MNLIVYFSRKGENYVNGAIKTLEKGNTEIVAEKIQAYAGGDLAQIVPVKEYSGSYYKCIEEAKGELNENARPKYRPLDIDIARYDKVFLCYPNWWGTMPMCVYTFLEDYDFSGKKILPVCTNEGSGMGSSVRDLKRILQNAEIDAGLSVHGAKAGASDGAIKKYLSEVM